MNNFWQNVKGFSTDMYETTMQIVKSYFGDIFETIREELCKNKFCICVNYIGSLIGIIISTILIGLILFHSFEMLYIFLLIGFGMIVSFGLLWFWVTYINRLTNNRVIKIITFQILLIMILGIVLIFKVIVL